MMYRNGTCMYRSGTTKNICTEIDLICTEVVMYRNCPPLCTETVMYRKRPNPYNICLRAFFPWTSWISRHQKGKPFWIYWSKRRWDGSGTICTICKSFAPHSRQITTPVPHLSVFTGQMPFLPPNQQFQSTEGYCYLTAITVRDIPCLELSVDLRHLCSEGPKSEI